MNSKGLASMNRKKLISGIVKFFVVMAMGCVCGCGCAEDDEDEMPTQEEIVQFCRSKLVESYDEESLKTFELSDFSVDEEDTVTVRARVRILGKNFVTDPGRSWGGVRGTAVFTLRDIGEGDGLHIVDFRFE